MGQRSATASRGQRGPKAPRSRASDRLNRGQLSNISSRVAGNTTQGLLRAKSQIVVLSGAGISVNAGFPDFRSKIGLHRSQRRLFDISVYNNDESTRDFHHMIEGLYNKSLRAVPTPFHFFLERLAASGQLVRHYTQNIDCIEDNLPYLKPHDAPTSSKEQRSKTIQLHGRLRTMVCQKCRLEDSFAPDLFHEMSVSICPRCDEIETRRVAEGKRSRGIGRLRPRIVLYGEANPDEDLIGETVEKDLQKPIDTVLVVGTTMKVPGMKRLVTEFSRAAKARPASTVIWVSKEAPPAQLKRVFDVILLSDCDDTIALLE